MQCDDIGSIIVTIALHCHGTVIQLDLPYERQHVFRNTRLFSKAGDFESVYSERFFNKNPLDLNELSSIFAKDLNDSSVELIDEYALHHKHKYKKMLSGWFISYPKEKVENICRTFHTVTFDKSLSIYDTGMSIDECIIEYFFPELQGCFVISVHEKVEPNLYRLMYPVSRENKMLDLFNLDDFHTFATIFGKDLPDLNSVSSRLDVENFVKMEYKITKDKNLDENEKENAIKQIHTEIYNIVDNWNITIQNGKIADIRMSYLIGLIKELVGERCKVNIFDYSCNGITKYLPPSQNIYKQYVTPPDIENPPENWGGKKRLHKIKTRKEKRKTKKNKNKKHFRNKRRTIKERKLRKFIY